MSDTSRDHQPSAPRRACALISAEHAEPLHAHAPPKPVAWLLLEDPGPWGEVAAARSARVAQPIRAAAAERGLRLQLIRRHGGHAPEGRTCYLAWSAYDLGWIERRRLARLEDVLDADLDALAAGRRPGFGEPVTAPVFLVCTHGKVDACCAQFGHPAARALTAAFGEAVWQTSHVGGCRFAANLVCLPHGIYYGRLTPEAAVRAAAAYADGRIAVDAYRGRAGAPQAVQAAEYHVRRQEGLTGIDDLSLVTHQRLADGRDEVCFHAGPYAYQVQVRLEPHGAPRAHGCGSDKRWIPDAYRLLHLHRTGVRPEPAGRSRWRATRATGDRP